MSPRITVGILNYNKKNLHEAINSARSQTYNEIDILVVDNGSYNRPIIEPYVNYYFIDKNRGVAGGRNAVMSAALTEWVYMLDADDLIVPEAIKTLASKIEGYDIVVPNTFEPLTLDAIKSNNYLPYSALISKRGWMLNNYYEQVGEYHIEDWDFWIKAACNFDIRVRTIPNNLFIHRFEENSVSLHYSDPYIFGPIIQSIREKHKSLYG